MDEINKLRVFNKLKSTYRFAKVEDRNESSAEHSWGCLIMADFFISKFKIPIDKIKVYELLMYHDVVEIEANDTQIHPEVDSSGQKEREEIASKVLYEKFPQPLNNKFLNSFIEFNEGITVESKFAKIIDALEADIHDLDYKKDWNGWTKDFFIKKREHLFNEFPELKLYFNELVVYLEKNKYFD